MKYEIKAEVLEKIIAKQKELIDLQGITISYFRKYSGEAERITRFMNAIHEKQSDLQALESEAEPIPAKEIKKGE
jgi:hypothetical protein